MGKNNLMANCRSIKPKRAGGGHGGN